MTHEVEELHFFVSDSDPLVVDVGEQLGGDDEAGRLVVVVRMKLRVLSMSVRGSPAQFLLI